MKITIDNQDGAGVRDYTSSLSASAPLEWKRSLNAPTSCTFRLLLAASDPPVPVRYANVNVTDDQNVVLFTGYVVSPSKALALGVNSTGTEAEILVTAISD